MVLRTRRIFTTEKRRPLGGAEGHHIESADGLTSALKTPVPTPAN